MAQDNGGRSLVDDVYRGLKDDICLGRLQPGERIHLGALCKQRGVSLSVVREAVTRLSSERLVEARPQHGFRVWPLSVDDLLDLTRVRVELEVLAVRDSVTSGDLAWESELVAAHHRLVGSMRRPSSPLTEPNYAWMTAHRDFHTALASACTSPLLKQLRQQLFDSAELYRQWSWAPARARAKQTRNLAKEHKELLDAAVAHDEDRTVALITRHIERTSELLLAARAPEVTVPWQDLDPGREPAPAKHARSATPRPANR